VIVERRVLTMNMDSDSTDRQPWDYTRFVLAFVGFMLATSGVVLSLPGPAILGVIVLILSIYSFYAKPWPDE
jgi:hypothetical protein